MAYNVKTFAKKKNIDLRTKIHTESDGNWWSLEDLLNEYAQKVVKNLTIPVVSESVCYTKDCCQHSMFKELCLSDNARKTCKKQTVR